MLSVDPLADERSWVSPYSYVQNSPVMRVDPSGALDTESTHTDEDGNVIAVRNDGDYGVYKHDGTREEALKSFNENYSSSNTSAGGEKMGETEYIDEFVSPETGKPMTNYKIQFGKSFDPIVEAYHKESEDMSLPKVAARSGPGGRYDIKSEYGNIGAKLNGKYATSRSAGNYLAGLNASGRRFLGKKLTFDRFQRMAGALHVNPNISKIDLGDIFLVGTKYGPSPYYGENKYQYRMSRAGWSHAERINGR